MTVGLDLGNGGSFRGAERRGSRLIGPVLRTLAALLLAPVLPPAAVFVACGAGRSLSVSAVLSAGAYLVFQFLFAGPGLMLWGIAILHALACAARTIWRRPLPQ